MKNRISLSDVVAGVALVCMLGALVSPLWMPDVQAESANAANPMTLPAKTNIAIGGTVYATSSVMWSNDSLNVGFAICNPGPSNIWCAAGQPAVVNKGLLVPSGTTVAWPYPTTDIIYGIGPANSNNWSIVGGAR